MSGRIFAGKYAVLLPGAGAAAFFCFLNNLSELRILTTFYLAKNGHH